MVAPDHRRQPDMGLTAGRCVRSDVRAPAASTEFHGLVVGINDGDTMALRIQELTDKRLQPFVADLAVELRQLLAARCVAVSAAAKHPPISSLSSILATSTQTVPESIFHVRFLFGRGGSTVLRMGIDRSSSLPCSNLQQTQSAHLLRAERSHRPESR